MRKASAAFDEIRNKLMMDSEFKSEYDKLKPRYEVISSIIKVRTEQNANE